MSKTINLGRVTAYADAVAAGYTGTREEFANDLANAANYAAEAGDAAETATEAATTASTAAETATEKAEEASADAEQAHADAQAILGAKETAVAAAATATSKAGEAANSAQQAAASETAAAGSATTASNAATSATASKNAAATSETNAANSANAAAQTLTNVNQAGAAQVAAIQAKGTEVLNSIPADYTELSNDVDDLKSDLSDDEELLFDENTSTDTATVNPTFSSGYCLPSGDITVHANYQYTNIIPVQPGDVIHGAAVVNPGQTSAPPNPCYVRYWCAYNGNNAVESKGDSTGTIKTFTVPNGVDGIRLTMNLVLYEADSLVVYVARTTTTKTVKPELITVPDQTLIKDSTNAVSGGAVYNALLTEKIGNNLINKTAAIEGAVQSGGTIGTDGSWANYKTSDYISVSSAKTYKLYLANANGQSSNTTRLIYCLFDAQKTALSYTNEIGVGYLTFTPSVGGFVRVCCEDATSSYFSTSLMLIDDTTAIPYENYNLELLLNNNISPVNNKFIGNILRGKKWCPCGDSFTAYTNAVFPSGLYAGYVKTYPYLIALRNEMQILSAFFASGRTLAYPSDGTFTNSLTCPTNAGYYQNIPEDVDIITIMLGINDCQHTGSGSTGDGEDATGEITLGTIDDNTTATYYGAWNVVLGWIRDNRPFAHVGIIVTNGTERQDYTEAQIAIARKWGYPLINLNGDDKTPAMLRCYNTSMSTTLKTLLKQKQAVDYDGTQTGSVNLHPNYKAHEYESVFIENWLRTL